MKQVNLRGFEASSLATISGSGDDESLLRQSHNHYGESFYGSWDIRQQNRVSDQAGQVFPLTERAGLSGAPQYSLSRSSRRLPQGSRCKPDKSNQDTFSHWIRAFYSVLSVCACGEASGPPIGILLRPPLVGSYRIVKTHGLPTSNSSLGIA